MVAVGPGLASPSVAITPFGLRRMNPLPVGAARVQRPLVPPQTLPRPRLNDWLDRAASGRLALVIGEAGFGKTTLLADWSSRTGRRTAWYRLERDDRDWLTLIRHLVAAGREADEGFAPESYQLLCALGPGGPAEDEITVSLAREMAAFGAADARGFSLILDDYNAIEGCEDTDPVVRAMIEATGPGFSLVIAARTVPDLPATRVRGRGAVRRLDEDQLRFDLPETAALFGEAYGIPLEPDVAADLVVRSEGWAALLTLVRTRLEERADADPRALIAQLSATEGDLYDFLAGEVLVDLPPALSEFLMRVSILAEVDARTAQIVVGGEPAAVEASIAEAETLGLLPRAGRGLTHRFHPLVRDFLLAKLEARIGVDELRRQHLALAEVLEPTDWRASALHYRAAGEPEEAARVVDEAIPSIIGSGSFEAALPLLDGTAGPSDRPGALILRSRIEYARGNLGRARSLAERAIATANDALSGTAMLNLAALEGVAGFPDSTIRRAEEALKRPLADSERRIAEASLLLRDAQTDGNLAELADALRMLASQQEFAGLRRYAAISYLNLAGDLIWLGDPHGAVKSAVRAEAGLADAPDSVERVSALAARALALFQLRKLVEAAAVIHAMQATASPLCRIEAGVEIAQLEAAYGSVERAREAVERIDATIIPEPYKGLMELAEGAISLRRGEHDAALRHGLESRRLVVNDAAGLFRTGLLVARARLLLDQAPEEAGLAALANLAARQGSRPAVNIAALLAAAWRPQPIGRELTALDFVDRHIVSLLAEELSRRLADLGPPAAEVVRDEAHARPERWRTALRLVIAQPGANGRAAARLLAEIGDVDDAAFLRSLVKGSKQLREPAAKLTRRLAPKAALRDLGMLRLELGGRAAVETTRRKSMALLCFLATRPRLAATRDEALEALWPEFNPVTGGNSLHQAIYYLRRIFDPDYREGISATYLRFDGEVVSIDQRLVESDSGRCWQLLHRTTAQDLDATEQIVEMYHGRFAIDFMYEEWSTDYRETLHAAVLGRAEAAMAISLAAGDMERAIRLGTAMLAVDPSADSIELALLRAYKASDRPAAAGEQYAHYASTLRDQLGVEPPPLDAI